MLTRRSLCFAAFALLLPLAGCTVESGAPAQTAAKSDAGSSTGSKSGESTFSIPSDLTGRVEIDGSSTVFPISAAIGEEFMIATDSGVMVDVGESGTGSGFKRFVAGETDISDASRRIKDSESKDAEGAGIEYEEIKVATDGISVVVNKEDDWIDSITLAQLKKFWRADSPIKTWKDLDPSYPDIEVKLYGPGPESGTFDYFNEEVLGDDAPRAASEYSASADDNQTIKGVSDNRGGLGYFGFSYYLNAKDRLKGLSIDAGEGPVEPTSANIESGKYAPLARPLFLYVNKAKAAENEATKTFLRYYVSPAGQEIIRDENFVTLSDEALAESREKVKMLVGE